MARKLPSNDAPRSVGPFFLAEVVNPYKQGNLGFPWQTQNPEMLDSLSHPCRPPIGRAAKNFADGVTAGALVPRLWDNQPQRTLPNLLP
jgi:hypothetical protein